MDPAVLKAEYKAANDALDQIEDVVDAYRVANQLDMLTPAVKQTLSARVQLAAETARDHLNTFLLELRTP